MSGASIAVNAERLSLAGVLGHQGATALREQGQQLIKACPATELVLDFSAVERANSVGLSLILCLLRDAQGLGKSLRVEGLPSELRQLAQVSGLERVLELG